MTESPEIYAGREGVAGLVNATRLESRFKAPRSVVVDRARGSLYLADSENHVIRRIPLGAGQSIETLAGNGQPGSSDGNRTAAQFNNPQGVALDGRGFLWVADTGNHTIRRINLQTGEATTVAGQPGVPGFQDGQGSGARFSSPKGIGIRPETLAQQLAREQSGLPPPAVVVLVADSPNNALRLVDESGLAETVVTRRNRAIAPLGSQNDLSNPRSVAADASGNIHVSEEDGEVLTILSNGEVVGTAQQSTFQEPQDLIVGSDGSVVVAESQRTGQRVVFGAPQIFSLTPDSVAPEGGDLLIEGRNFAPETIVVVDGKVLSNVTTRDTGSIAVRTPVLTPGLKTLTVLNRGGIDQVALGVPAPPLDTLPAGYITTVAGGSDFTGDGGLALEANLREPLDITVDPAGNLIIADTLLHRVRRIDAQTGVITTVLGTGRQEFSPAEGGLAITTSISNPRCVVSDLSGNFYVCLPGLLIRVDADSGLVRRIAGGETAFGGDGGPAREAVISPQDLVIEEDGNLLIADLEAATVRRIDVATGLIDSVVGNGSRESLGDGGPAFQAGIDPSGLIFDVQGNLYISDLSNHRIRRVDAVTGLIDTLAGGPGTPLVAPRGLAFEGGGDLFVAGQNFLYKIDPESGLIKTVTDNFDDSNDVPLSDFLSQTPSGLTFDGGGNLYFTEFARDRIRRLDAVSQRVTTIAGREAGRVGDGRLS